MVDGPEAVGSAAIGIVCGKIAAGKSTLVNELGRLPGTIVVREDHWLARLYPSEQNSLAYFVRNAARPRSAIETHLVDLLRSGLSIVLDVPSNTPSSRAWMRTLFEGAGCSHRFHYPDVANEVCKDRLRRRNEGGGHGLTVSDQDFDHFNAPFVPPTAE